MSTVHTPEEKTWGLILHLSMFAGYLVPMAGFVAPIVIWQVQKEKLPMLDVHGRIVVNWILSSLIYGVVSWLLCFVLIGFLLLPILGICAVAFPIIGAIKANNGEAWRYPLSLTFF